MTSFKSIDEISVPGARDECEEWLASIVCERDFETVSIDEFPKLFRKVVRQVLKSAHAASLLDEFAELADLKQWDTKKLRKLQEENSYSYIQLYSWWGEMLLQINERR